MIKVESLKEYKRILSKEDFEVLGNKIFMITKFVDMPGFIEDPWYTGHYEKVYNELNEAIQKILKKLS